MPIIAVGIYHLGAGILLEEILCLESIIMITNKNSTITAPTYINIKEKAINSMPIMMASAAVIMKDMMRDNTLYITTCVVMVKAMLLMRIPLRNQNNNDGESIDMKT